jgi:hypothetical protein
MSGFRPALRGSAVVVGLLLVASLVTANSSASATSTRAPAVAASSARAARYAGQPPRNYVPYSGARFGYLTRGMAEQSRIRNQVLATIQSTWGGPRDRNGLPLATNGTIRIASWSFGDMGIAKALYAAYRRGVSVQVISAASINKTHPELHWLKKRLGGALYKRGVAGTQDKVSFVRTCNGSCRGRGGTQHAKFFLFDNVGFAHHRRIVFQGSMNLTSFAWHGQWNSAQVSQDTPAYNQFLTVFKEMRPGTYVSRPYRDYSYNQPTESIFFPELPWTRFNDPVLRMLDRTRCTNAGAFAHTKIRINQYAIYQSRGEMIAKRLRQLWNQGCDIAIIYAVTTRPVLGILRNHSGRGAIPMKESIIRGSDGTISKYNHSKWMMIAGNYSGQPNQWKTISGSANWANLALSSDEQMQIVDGYATARSYLQNFNTTWVQRTSGPPTLAYIADGRVTPLPQNDIPWGRGIYKHMSED